MKLRYDNLIIGGSFDAVYLAFKEGYHIVYKELEKPFDQDTIDGKNKLDVFDLMVFLLTMADLNPFSSKVADLRIEGNRVTVSRSQTLDF